MEEEGVGLLVMSGLEKSWLGKSERGSLFVGKVGRCAKVGFEYGIQGKRRWIDNCRGRLCAQEDLGKEEERKVGDW